MKPESWQHASCQAVCMEHWDRGPTCKRQGGPDESLARRSRTRVRSPHPAEQGVNTTARSMEVGAPAWCRPRAHTAVGAPTASPPRAPPARTAGSPGPPRTSRPPSVAAPPPGWQTAASGNSCCTCALRCGAKQLLSVAGLCHTGWAWGLLVQCRARSCWVNYAGCDILSCWSSSSNTSHRGVPQMVAPNATCTGKRGLTLGPGCQLSCTQLT